MTRQGFNEMAPSAKQLVFVFMAATIVAVVVFLCGVLVGRGVPLNRSGDPFDLTGDLVRAEGQTGGSAALSPATAAGSADELTYARRLGGGDPVPETVGRAPQPAAEAPTEVQPVPEGAREAPSRSAPSAPAVASESGADRQGRQDSGFSVQVTALRGRDEATQIVQRLVAKGYPAYVVDPAPGAPAAVFRVRVGRSLSRQEAESVLHRLETEEQFKPWITR